MTIIRDMPLADGRQGYVLLSQVEHARLAGELAAAWGSEAVAPLVPREAIVATVFHHDDGWIDWERRPQVDRASGQPHPFTDMPNEAKFDIWAKSIRAARDVGSLGGTIVAWHFIELPQGTNHWQPTASELDDATRAFINTYRELADGWLDEWLAEDAANMKATAQRALEWLQMFDVVSLWLCMAEQHEPRAFDLPGGAEMVMTPQRGSCVEVDPWPLTEEHLRLEIAGRHIAHRPYRDTADLASERGEIVELAWNLVPRA